MIDKSINPNIDRILLRLKTIPENPGVYQHLDADGNVIYVGKARNLQRRVSSYFSHYDDKSAKIKMLVRNIYDTRVTVVDTEVDALLLENTLIKQLQPRYNSMLKDDKSYPYLCITAEEYPRIVFTRNRKLKGQYFGPYPNQAVLRELQGIIRQLFCYRTCNMPLREEVITAPGARLQRPCMKHQIGLCNAPCANKESRQDYLDTINSIRKILKGDFDDIVLKLKKQMYSLAEQLRFEEAEQVKNKLHTLTTYQSRSTVVGANVKDVDVFAIINDNAKYAYINMMRIKNGSIVYSFSHEVQKHLDEDSPTLLSTVIPALHESTESTATEVIVPMPVPDIPEDYLSQTVPTKGDRYKLLQLSQFNAESYMKQCLHQRALLNPEEAAAIDGENGTKVSQLLLRIQKELHLPKPPVNIECFDNSNIQGAYPVAAMVRFTNGKPNKKEYRKFNIKSVEGPDDYASMAEVIERRYSRLVAEGKPLPELLIVDGGQGQMEVARQVIVDHLGLDIPIAGLAKDDRHHTSQLLYGFPPAVIGLKPTDPLFHLLERIQDEVHRFAITFHRAKRSKGTLRTGLTDIPGIGPKTAHDLLLKYGSVKQIAIQSQEELSKTIGQHKAAILLAYLNRT